MEHRSLPAFDEGPQADWTRRVQAAADRHVYPATPDIAGSVARRLHPGRAAARPTPRVRWAFAIVMLLVAAALMAVPEVRAAVIEVLRIGAARIFRSPPTAQPQATLVPTAGAPAATRTPDLSRLLDLAGKTTLDAAASRVDFTLGLPHYPPDLGPPDGVFVQEEPGQVVVMVWLDRAAIGKVRLGLFQMTADAYFEKLQPQVIEETDVNGERAVWVAGPYMLATRSGDRGLRRLVEGHTLIWTAGSMTYRLETGLGLEEARRIAESVR